MNDPLVSVIIPTYNRPDMLVEATRSVLAQTYSNIEILVVNDGSLIDPAEALQTAGLMAKIKLLRQSNLGLSAARNNGIRKAQGQLITFLDDDDLYTDDKVAKQASYFLSHPDAAIVHSWFSKFDALHKNLGVRKTSWFKGNIYPEILGQWSVLMAAPCVMVRREVFDAVGFFDESLKMAEDLDMWRRIARRWPLHLVEEPLVRIRRQVLSMSSNKSAASEGFRTMLERAFTDDASLSKRQRQHFLAAMYTGTALNLLGEGTDLEMKKVRDDALKALRLSPLQVRAMAAWALSFIPLSMRSTLIAIVRRLRFSSDK